MSKILFLPFWLILLVTSLSAQNSPQGFKYQAVVQINGNLLTGNVGARFTIREGNPNGSIVYQEIQFPMANDNGVIAVTIGPEGDGIATGNPFQNIDWGNATFFLQTEVDPNGATNYTNLGTSQIMSVPYAIYSDRARSAITANTALNENQTLSLAGSSLSISSSNSAVTLPWTLSGANAYRLGGNVGIGTSTPSQNLTVRSTILSENGVGNPKTRIYVNGDAGRMETYGGNNELNTVIGSREGFANFGYIGVANQNGSLEAALLVDDFGNGVVVADGANGGIKSFTMPHPEQSDKKIWYACIEGPEAAAYERGTGVLIDGEAFISFSDTYQIVANPATMTVILTPLSANSKGLAVIEKTENGFNVKELDGGTGSYRFDWEVKCVRKGHESFQVIRDSSWGQPTKASALDK